MTIEHDRIEGVIGNAIEAWADKDTRARVIAAALALDGLSFGNAAKRDAYCLALYPYDSPARARAQGATDSSCGLVCEHLLRAICVDDERLYRPVEPRKVGRDDPTTPGRDWGVVTLQLEIAKAHGAWVPATPDARPLPGDMLLIGGSGAPPKGGWGAGGYTGEHVLTVTEITGEMLHSCDGGQGDSLTGHSTAIRRCVRRLVEHDGALRVVDVGNPARWRRVQGWIDVGRLRLRS